MVDIPARMKQLIGTTADWAANDLVIGDGEFAVERGATGTLLKMGNGVDRFSVLPYISTGGGGGTTLPADAQGALINDGAGGLSWLGTATGGTAASKGKILLLDANGIVGATSLPVTSVAGTAAQAGKILVLDAAGHIPTSAISTTSTGGAATDSGKIPTLGAAGRLPTTMLPIDALEFGGLVTPKAGAEYPTAPTVDTMWIVSGVPGSGYTFTAGDLNGQIVENTDIIIYDVKKTVFQHVGSTLNYAGAQSKAQADNLYFHAPLFSTTVDYAKGALVRYGANVYRANVVSPKGAWNAAHWSAVAFMDDLPKVPTPLFVAFDPTHVYAKGDIVVEKNHLYRAIGAVPAGAFKAAQWTAVVFKADLPDTIDNYDATATYAVGDVIVRGGNLLRSNAVQAAGPFAAAKWDTVALASTAHANTWSAAQTFAGVNTYTGRVIVPPKAVGNGNINLATGMDFLVTPTADMTFAFTNLTAGQRGMIHLENTAAHAVTLGAGIQAPADLATDLATGDHVLSYWCITGTTVVLTYSAEIV